MSESRPQSAKVMAALAVAALKRVAAKCVGKGAKFDKLNWGWRMLIASEVDEGAVASLVARHKTMVNGHPDTGPDGHNRHEQSYG